MQGLVTTKDAKIRWRVLNKLENEPNLTLQNLAEDFQRLINVWQDAKVMEVSSVSYIKKVRQENKVKKKKIILQTPVTHVENYIFITTVHTETKTVFVAKIGHKKTHYKIKIKNE